MSRNLVTLSDPKHGSIDINVAMGEQSIEENVSYILTDFVTELAIAVRSSLRGAADSVAIAYCEPVTYEFRFAGAAKSNPVVFEIMQYPDEDRHHRDRQTVFSIRRNRGHIVKPFYVALADLQQRMRAKDYEEAWRHPFPTAIVNELTELAQRMRLTRTNGY